MIIPATSRTPEVTFTAEGCTIKGECYPEDISEFSAPIIKHLDNDLTESNPYSVEIELYYFNSSSAKFFFDLFESLDESAAVNKQLKVIWKYREEDDTMLDAGEEFQEDLKNLKFSLEALV